MSGILEQWRQYAPMLLEGLATTTWICALATGIGIAFGLLMACLAMAGPAFIRRSVRVYVEIMRGLPILILLFVLYYGGPDVYKRQPLGWRGSPRRSVRSRPPGAVPRPR